MARITAPVLLLVLAGIVGATQTRPRPPAQKAAPVPAKKTVLVPLLDVLPSVFERTRNGWVMAGSTLMGRRTKSHDDAVRDIDLFVEQYNAATAPVMQREQAALMKKYKLQLLALLAGLSQNRGIAAYYYGSLIPTEPRETPFWFATHKENGLTLLVSGLLSPNKYNTIRVETKERAAKTINSILIPSLSRLETLWQFPEIKYFGFAMGYGSENFLNEGKPEADPRSEAVVVVLPRDKCKEFIAGQITDQELIDSADIYLADREMDRGFKKVTLKL